MKYFLVWSMTLAMGPQAFAENKPAAHCEASITYVTRGVSYHGSNAIEVTLKTGKLPAEESIKRVRFYGRKEVVDLGNSVTCIHKQLSENVYSIKSPFPENGLDGSYHFSFRVSTGSLTAECPGYGLAHIGSFFVETNKNTYWINPDLSSSKDFYFDRFGFEQLLTKGDGSTLRSDMMYYNPARCSP